MNLKNSKYLVLGILLAIGACQTSEKSTDPTPLDLSFAPMDDSLRLPDNFDAVVVADSLGRGRHLAIRENGDLYVHLGSKTADGNSIIALRDTSGDGIADLMEDFAPYPGTGIEIHKNHLYFATKGRIYRMAFNGNSLVPTMQIDTIAKLEGSDGGHSEKTFTFDQSGNMYVNVGSRSNACQEEMRSKGSKGKDPCIELEKRAGIWKFNDSALEQVQTREMRFATGIRNAVGITWDKASNKLYCMQHGRDDLHRFWPDIFTPEQNVELPAEELMLVNDGDDFGWPYCYYDPQQKQRFLNPEYGGDGKTIGRCESAKDPVYGFPGHWGPNDLLFYQGSQFPAKYHGGAFIAFHGSWNRLGHPQDGFKIMFLPMKDGTVHGEPEVFADAFIGAPSIDAPGDAKYRPCGLAEGPDGSLYIVDSMKGRVWRIVHAPSA